MITIAETPMTSALKRTLYRWGPDIFRVGHLDLSDLQWCTFPTGFLLSVDGEPVSYFRALRHACQIDGRQVVIGGLGGLVTAPAYQRQGYGARVATAALNALRDDWRVDAALAFCLDHLLSFYGRLGACVLPGPVMVQTRTRTAPAPFNALWWPFRPELSTVTGFDLGCPLW
jgi:GNAT superfamily N-acetyltransferase